MMIAKAGRGDMKDKNLSYPIKIGNTTFIVCMKQSENVKKI